MGELGSEDVVLQLKEAVAAETVRVKPNAVVLGGSGELPDDRGLAPALGVGFEVVGEELRRKPAAELVALGVEGGSELLPPVIGGFTEDLVDHRSDRREQIAVVTVVIY